ncbi:MAG TPA: hypothetical protein VHN20_16070 [Beijerinckiaceae bacterium]|nr:hypothetical protein [Beijerinckiaceae bacterium]
MPTLDTIGERASGTERAPSPAEPVGAAERAVLVQLEERVPGVIARQRRRQTVLNREAQEHVPAPAKRS